MPSAAPVPGKPHDAASLAQFRFSGRELAGAVADLGVMVPIVVALIVGNGLSPTAVLVPAGLLYVAAALVYRLPIPVQPLKAFGAIAIAEGLGTSEIAAGALLMGGTFLVLGATGVLDVVGRAFPRPVIRGIQVSVGLLFLKIAHQLVTRTPEAFDDHRLATSTSVVLAVVVVAVLLALRTHGIALALVTIAGVVALVRSGGAVELGPSPLTVPTLDGAAFATAFVLLVVPQVPLTFANSCLATADAARAYYGAGPARRVTPNRLAVSLGLANLGAGAIAGMPVCHGAGGLSAHHAFGARTGGAPVAIGAVLLGLGIGLGAGLADLLAAVPVALLAALLAVSGTLHLTLARDLRGRFDWTVAAGVGVLGLMTNIAIAVALGLLTWWAVAALRKIRARRLADARL